MHALLLQTILIFALVPASQHRLQKRSYPPPNLVWQRIAPVPPGLIPPPVVHGPPVATRAIHTHTQHHTLQRVPVAVPRPYPVQVPVANPVPFPVAKPYPVHVPVKQLVHVPYKVHVPVPNPIPAPYPVVKTQYVDRVQHVKVPSPYPVHVKVPHPYPVVKHVFVEKKVAVPYKVPHPYPVPHPVPVPVPYPPPASAPTPTYEPHQPHQPETHYSAAPPYSLDEASLPKPAPKYNSAEFEDFFRKLHSEPYSSVGAASPEMAAYSSGGTSHEKTDRSSETRRIRHKVNHDRNGPFNTRSREAIYPIGDSRETDEALAQAEFAAAHGYGHQDISAVDIQRAAKLGPTQIGWTWAENYGSETGLSGQVYENPPLSEANFDAVINPVAVAQIVQRKEK